MDKKTKVGRKKKYDTQMLIGLVNKYADENPYSVIKIADLTKRFEIKHYIWRDYTEVRKYIDKLNNTSKILSMPKENIALNSVDDFFICMIHGTSGFVGLKVLLNIKKGSVFYKKAEPW